MRHLLIGLLLTCACEQPPPPWRGQPRGEVIDESKPFLPTPRHRTLLGDAGLVALADDAGADAGEPLGNPVKPRVNRVGGLWTSCYQGFQPSGVPRRDVTRLGLMCGPVNGMSLLGDTRVGTVSPGDRAHHTFSARAGECYRLFAVAAGVADLDVTVLSSRGSRLTGDEMDGSWPIVDLERPFCTFDDDKFTVEVAGGGEGDAGRYALQIWKLQGPKK